MKIDPNKPILLISPKCISFPVGLSHIAASIRQAGFRVECINLSQTPDHVIEKEKHDIVATGGLACHFNDVCEIVTVAKETGCRVIVGGGLVTADPEFISKYIPADHFVLGEGDRTIGEILRAMAFGSPVPRIIQGGEIEDLDSLPFPDYESFGFRRYLDEFKPSDAFFTDMFDNPRIYPLVASRACPFQCTFCYSPLGKKYRQRSVDSIIKELGYSIPRYRINIVQMVDELFAYNEQRVYEFCEKFNTLRRSFDWDIRWGCCLRVDRLLPEMLDALRDSGCTWVQYGFESYNSTVLKSMHKKITQEQIHNAIHLTLEKNISVQANFIFGDREETPETADETLSFWKGHTEAGILLFYIWAVPDSELFRYCLQKKIIQEKLEYYRNGVFAIRNMTGMTDEEFDIMKSKITISILKHTPKRVPQHVTNNSVTVQCPHCNVVTTYQNFMVYMNCTLPVILLGKPGLRWFFKQMYCRNCRKSFMATSRLAMIWFGIVVALYHPLLAGLYKKIVSLRSSVISNPGDFSKTTRVEK